MKKYYALFNPQANNCKGEAEAKRLDAILGTENIVYVNVLEMQDYEAFLSGLLEEDEVIVCGGDGTLNRFVNTINNLDVANKIWYFACGSGNDFLRDVQEQHEGQLIPMEEYVKGLPTVTVNGKEYAFLNGVGYGIDGYCCEVGDKLRAENPEKNIDYAGIAVKGLLFHYKTTDAVVIVDGKEYEFKKVWLAPTMNGRYYGGGMLPAPAQRREDDKLSVMLFHGSGKLKTLMIFPKIFKGEHVKSVKHVTVLSGKEITVKFKDPRPLQIDGETILGVEEYTARK